MFDVIITGGSGYIGSSLAEYFLNKGLKVKTVDIKPQNKELKQLGIEHAICDITSINDVLKNVKNTEVIIHSAIIQIPLINEKRKLGHDVNIIGTQNVCKAVETLNMKGMILAGSWHVFGETGLAGLVGEGFGYRPDRVEDRARLYALCKNGQEIITRVYNEFSDKIYGIIRMGTVLGDKMPEKTAANIFINQALQGKDLTPFKHSMHRPMNYVSIRDVQEGFYRFAKNILDNKIGKKDNSLEHITNLVYPEPMTILELANTICEIVRRHTKGKIQPSVKIVDKELPIIFDKDDKYKVKFDISKAKEFLGFDKLTHPKEEIENIIKLRSNR